MIRVFVWLFFSCEFVAQSARRMKHTKRTRTTFACASGSDEVLGERFELRTRGDEGRHVFVGVFP